MHITEQQEHINIVVCSYLSVYVYVYARDQASCIASCQLKTRSIGNYQQTAATASQLVIKKIVKLQ